MRAGSRPWRPARRAGIALRVLAVAAAAALAVAAAPASVVAACSAGVAWYRAWPPRRLFLAALACLPMIAAWLAASGAAAGTIGAAVTAPYHAWLTMWRLGGAGHWLTAAAVIAPAAIPIGLTAGGLAWTYRRRSMEAGAGGLSPAAAIAFDQRQWRHQVRSARARISAPGSVPLTTRRDAIVAGAVIRSVQHRGGPLAALPYQRLRSHQVIIGTTGTGKTTLLLRLWAGFMAAGLRRHAAGLGPPPLLAVLDCKGGADARKIADRARRVLRDAGARSTAIWPDEASLSLWSLPPQQLTTTLVDLVEHGTGSAAYYADVMEALVALAVEAPCGPPASAADLIARLEPGWLSMAYAAAGSAADHDLIRSASRHLTDVAMRFRTLFRRLGTGLDGPGGFGDADAWYCILEGTDEIAVAEAQARALVDLLASFAVRGPAPREILLAVDEFSAVSRRLPIWQLYERARSLGLAVQVSAQSWQGLAAGEDERYRIAASAEGGIWLLRTPHPEPVAGLAGTRKVLDTSRPLIRFPLWGRQGVSRVTETPVVDPGLIRNLDVGQAGYIYRGGVSYVQVRRLVAAAPSVAPGPGAAAARGPAERQPAWSETAAGEVLTVGPAAAGPLAGGSRDRQAAAAGAAAAAIRVPAGHDGGGDAGPGPGRPALPDVSPVLDAAFGPETA